MNIGKKIYYNIYFELYQNNLNNICKLINEVILYLNILKNQKNNIFHFEKEIGFKLYIKNYNLYCSQKFYENKSKSNVNYTDILEYFIYNFV